jgi:hypothetical protein
MKHGTTPALLSLLVLSAVCVVWRTGAVGTLDSRTEEAQPAEGALSLQDRYYMAVSHQAFLIREEATRRFLAEEMTLLEAAVLFRNTNRELLRLTGRSQYPSGVRGATVEEQFCRQVIHWASVELALRTDSARAVFEAELEAELDEHIRENGRPILPEVDSSALLSRMHVQPP